MIKDHVRMAIAKLCEQTEEAMENKLRAAYEIGYKTAIEEAVFNFRSVEMHESADLLARMTVEAKLGTSLN